MNRQTSIAETICVSVTFTLAITLPAFAQASVDPGVGLRNLLSWVLTLAGVTIALICVFHGIRCANEGRHIGPAVAGLIGGLVLAFGGSYIVSHYNGGGTIGI